MTIGSGACGAVQAVRVTILLLAVTACGTERITTPDHAVSADADGWSGGTLLLRSAAFVGADSVPLIVVGAETLAVKSLSPGSALIQLPDTNGVITLSVRFRTGGDAVASVRVHGFAAAGPGPRVDGVPFPWPPGAPTALALQDGRLVLVDFRSNAATPLTPDTNLGLPCLNGPVPSMAEPGLVVIAPRPNRSCGPVIAVPVGASSALPDTGPAAPASGYPAIHLGRGRWLISLKNSFSLFVGSASGGFTQSQVQCIEPTTFAISPRGDRVIPTQCWMGPAGGVPVMDPAAPGVAFTVAGLMGEGGAAFSDAGDTLFVAGEDPAYGYDLFALSATSGATLWSGSREGAGYLGVAVDPGRPWLYVADMAAGRPYVDVYDRKSLARVARLWMPQWAVDAAGTQLLSYAWWTIIVSSTGRRLYLSQDNWELPSGPPALPTFVVQFDLMP